MQKTELWIGIIGSILVVLLSGYYGIQYQQSMKSSGIPALKAVTGSGAVSASPAPGQSAANTVQLTSGEVAKHASEASCWLIINNKVYDATNYLNAHPGGKGRILAYCGTDATTAFATKDGEGQHSDTANQILGSYYIGDFGSTMSAKAIQSIQQNAPVPAARSGRGENNAQDDE
jgi:cytochrome b involved in lipid metabolism